jgi:hypothetical protein
MIDTRVVERMKVHQEHHFFHDVLRGTVNTV